MSDQTKTRRIRDLNDRLRTTRLGGRVMLSRGIAALPVEVSVRILNAVARFDEFSEDNDPYGEHDCASLTACGHRTIWKIDAYDKDMVYASEDPGDPSKTTRVMTVMLAEEY